MMKVIIAECSLRKFEGSTNLTIQIEPSNVAHLYMGLSLLQEGLIQSLPMLSLAGNIEMRFTLDDSKQKKKFSRLKTFTLGGSLVFALDDARLGYIKQFLLVYYRDDQGDVDHIDVEFVNQDSMSFDLTITVPSSKPGMSPDELKQHLGLED